MSNAEITWALIIPEVVRKAGGGAMNEASCHEFLSYLAMVSIFLLNPYITRMLGLVG